MMTKLPVIAIDGYSSTGKSSISKEIAKRLGIIHLDTGALYRAITYFALQNCPSSDGFNTEALVEQLPNIHLEFKEEQHQLSLFLNGENVAEKIRSMEVNQKVSDVAKMPEVRNFLLQTQRDIAANGGVVMDGRDIGSVVLPNADYKFFLTASVEERTKRRFLELKASGTETTMDEVRTNLIERDKKDSERAVAPLIQTEDAICIDNTNLDKEQTIEAILSYIKK